MQQVMTLLHVVGQQCCICLHGPKSLTGFKLYATSAKIVVVPCKWTQHVGPNTVASICKGLEGLLQIVPQGTTILRDQLKMNKMMISGNFKILGNF